jgi:Tfp pilus assembly protein PilF
MKQLRELIELYPEFVRAHEYLADIYNLKGMHTEAVEERKEAASLSRPDK